MLPGDLDDLERMVARVEAARSIEAAADHLRPDIVLPSAVRWVRRRLTLVRATLLICHSKWPSRGSVPMKWTTYGGSVMVETSARRNDCQSADWGPLEGTSAAFGEGFPLGAHRRVDGSRESGAGSRISAES